MIDVPLAAVANQSLSIQLDERFYDIELREAGGVVTATIARDGVALVSGLRVAGGTPLLPYRYQEAGNFLLTVADEEEPDWAQFGVGQFLVYLTAEELAAYRGA